MLSKPTTFRSRGSAFCPEAWPSKHLRSRTKYARTKSCRRWTAKFPAIKAAQAAFSCATSLAQEPQYPQYSSQAALAIRTLRPAVTSIDVMRRISLTAFRSKCWLYLCTRSTLRPFHTPATVETAPVGPRCHGPQAASGPKCGRSHGRCPGSCKRRRGRPGRGGVRWISVAQ